MEWDYIYREADEADFHAIAEFLERHDYAPKGQHWSRQDYVDWLKWKFLDNPYGPARTFIVEDSHNAIVGFRASLRAGCGQR